MANRPSYKQIASDQAAKIEELTKLVESLTQQPQGNISMSAPTPTPAVKQVKEGTATQLVLFNTTSKAPATSVEDSIRTRQNGMRNINFLTVTEEGESAKPVEALRMLIRQYNSQVPRSGFAVGTKSWYMDETVFPNFLAEVNGIIPQKHVG
jgi:hypothetical protein